MSTPLSVAVPFLLLLLDFRPRSRIQLNSSARQSQATAAQLLGPPKPGDGGSTLNSLRPLVWEKLPFFALSLASSIVTFLVQSKGHAVSVGVPLEPRLANAMASYLKYLGKVVWPTNLAIFYPHPHL